MKRTFFVFAVTVCISLFLISCDTAVTDDTGMTNDTEMTDDTENGNSDTQEDSMPGIDSILPSDTDSTGMTENTQESTEPDGTSQPGMPDSGQGAGNIVGLGDTVEMVMERIEEIIAGTQKYFTNSTGKERLSMLQARSAALSDAHYSDEEVTFEKEELKKADDKEYYFFFFTCGGMKYYYDVDAYTAEILYKNTEENS